MRLCMQCGKRFEGDVVFCAPACEAEWIDGEFPGEAVPWVAPVLTEPLADDGPEDTGPYLEDTVVPEAFFEVVDDIPY